MEVLRRLSPSRHRWRRLLSSLQLDPDDLESPIEPPGNDDFLVCGSPRSGTALVSAALWHPPSVVSVMEPWDAMRVPPADLCRSLRAEIEAGMLRRGRLDVNALLADGSVRWCRDGECPVRVAVEPGWQLGVKLPAFWRYLDLLPTTRFVVCLRSPAEVIASYRAQDGTLRDGLEYDIAFNRRLNEELRRATSDPVLRRIMLFDRIHDALLPHLGRPNVHVVRYERWFDDPVGQVEDLGRFLGAELDPHRVTVGEPQATPLPDSELAALRRHCRTAAALGYDR